MRSVYAKLLYLYPPEFRRDFAEEMTWCFAEASGDCRGGIRRARFLMREMSGLLQGACEAQLRSVPQLWKLSRRVVMISRNKRFRFPIAGIAFMIATLGCILYAIRLARSISYAMAGTRVQVYNYQPDHLSFVQTFGFAFGVTVVFTVIVLIAMHMTHRAGAQRLADAQTWPKQ